MLDTLIHKYLRIPYQLHVHVDKKVKRPRATVLLLHGMGNSGASWNQVASRLPDDIRIISLDLLGFGKSPSPRWLKYNTVIQAKSVIVTLLKLGINQQVIIVGHSMGSLVAIEMTKRYPLLVKSLILCSPPLYSEVERKTILPNPDQLLRNFYKLIQKYPTRIVDVAPLALKLKIVGSSFDVTDKNIDIYMAALESSILHQTSLVDIQRLQKPIQMIHGRFDPVVVKHNLDRVAQQNDNITLKVILAGHELMGAYIPAVVKAIELDTTR